jgi:hypothetical protein
MKGVAMGERLKKVLAWTKRRPWLYVLLLVLIPLSQHRIHGQILPDPCCPILSAGLGTIADLLKTVIGAPLSEIRQIQDEINKFQREVIWPLEAIAKAKALVREVSGLVSQLRSLIQMDVRSATLPQPVSLEQTLLSANPDRVNQVAGAYAAVYQTVPVPADAPPERRHLIDINDAVAMGAMKRAIQIDAMAEVELEAAERISQELGNAAPGSAPLLEAEAAAWLVRSHAYTQWALAELMRVRSAQLAHESTQMKFSVTSTTRTRGDVHQVLQPR